VTSDVAKVQLVDKRSVYKIHLCGNPWLMRTGINPICVIFWLKDLWSKREFIIELVNPTIQIVSNEEWRGPERQ